MSQRGLVHGSFASASKEDTGRFSESSVKDAKVLHQLELDVAALRGLPAHCLVHCLAAPPGTCCKIEPPGTACRWISRSCAK